MDDPFFVRNFVYGVEDSLISTTGVVIGMAWANFYRTDIIKTGLILVLVEALSMSYGSFVSEDSFLKMLGKQYTTAQVLGYALIMLMAYVAAGLVPLTPFLFNIKDGWRWSLILTIMCLYLLIYFVQGNYISALSTTAVGAMILIISIVVGSYLKS